MMGRPKEYQCKVCHFKYQGPGPLGIHYKEEPTHRPTYHLTKKNRAERKLKLMNPSQGETNLALDEFLDNPSAALEILDAKVLQQKDIISYATKQAQDATEKIKKLDELRKLLEPREVLASHGEVFHSR
jgi:hypothetical protein